MRKMIARRALAAFGKRYDYDVGYMEHMLTVSPAAFFKFGGLTKVAQHREAAPASSTSRWRPRSGAFFRW